MSKCLPRHFYHFDQNHIIFLLKQHSKLFFLKSLLFLWHEAPREIVIKSKLDHMFPLLKTFYDFRLHMQEMSNSLGGAQDSSLCDPCPPPSTFSHSTLLRCQSTRQQHEPSFSSASAPVLSMPLELQNLVLFLLEPSAPKWQEWLLYII